MLDKGEMMNSLVSKCLGLSNDEYFAVGSILENKIIIIRFEDHMMRNHAYVDAQ
jgi:hypothetical protein